MFTAGVTAGEGLVTRYDALLIGYCCVGVGLGPGGGGGGAENTVIDMWQSESTQARSRTSVRGWRLYGSGRKLVQMLAWLRVWQRVSMKRVRVLLLLRFLGML